jgi:hypothetical protein
MLFAMFCSSIVLPVRGGATSGRAVLADRAIMSSTRADRFSASVRAKSSVAGRGREVLRNLAGALRRLKVHGLDLDQGEMPLTVFGDGSNDTVSPVCRSNLRICDGET